MIVEPQVLRVTREHNRVCVELSLSPDLVFFQGHFPASPILPGIVQIGWAIDYARRYLGVAGPCVGMKAVKFTRAIQPQMPITLIATLADDGAQLQFVYRSGASECASGVALFARNAVFPDVALPT